MLTTCGILRPPHFRTYFPHKKHLCTSPFPFCLTYRYLPRLSTAQTVSFSVSLSSQAAPFFSRGLPCTATAPQFNRLSQSLLIHKKGENMRRNVAVLIVLNVPTRKVDADIFNFVEAQCRQRALPRGCEMTLLMPLGIGMQDDINVRTVERTEYCSCRTPECLVWDSVRVSVSIMLTRMRCLETMFTQNEWP